jgi:hypothetical protein
LHRKIGVFAPNLQKKVFNSHVSSAVVALVSACFQGVGGVGVRDGGVCLLSIYLLPPFSLCLWLLRLLCHAVPQTIGKHLQCYAVFVLQR